MRREVYKNLGGFKGTERTIQHMRKLVDEGKLDPLVVLTAQRIVKGVDRRDYPAQARAIFNFVKDGVSYVRDPVDVEVVKSPGLTLKTRTGDCDDQAVLFSALAESVGIRSAFKAIKADPRYPGEFTHVYSLVMLPGKGWVPADTIVPRAQLGWEAPGYEARVWSGNRSIASTAGHIGMGEIASMGEPIFANDQVFTPDEGGDAFGEFGYGMWDYEPVLADEREQISTIVDSPGDFWGGSADTDPGPGLKSRMLTRGVDGAQNVVTVDPGNWSRLARANANQAEAPGLGWNPFKEIGNGLRQIGTQVGNGLKQLRTNFDELGKSIATNIGLSTVDSRRKEARKAIEAALTQLWNQPGPQFALELHRRIQEFLDGLGKGKVEHIAMPPPKPEQEPAVEDQPLAKVPEHVLFQISKYVKLRAELQKRIDSGEFTGMRRYGAADRIKAYNQKIDEFKKQYGLAGLGQTAQEIVKGGLSMSLGPTTALAMQLIQGLGKAEDIRYATEEFKHYVEKFPIEDFQTAISDAAKAFAAVGGMLPAGEAAAPAEYRSKFEARIRGRYPDSSKSTSVRGPHYYYLHALKGELKGFVPKLESVKPLMNVASNVVEEKTGPETVQAAANVVKRAIESGAVPADQAQIALQIVQKAAQGYALTDAEKAIAARIAGAQPGSGVPGWLVAAGAAAAAAATLI